MVNHLRDNLFEYSKMISSQNILSPIRNSMRKQISWKQTKPTSHLMKVHIKSNIIVISLLHYFSTPFFKIFSNVLTIPFNFSFFFIVFPSSRIRNLSSEDGLIHLYSSLKTLSLPSPNIASPKNNPKLVIPSRVHKEMI